MRRQSWRSAIANVEGVAACKQAISCQDTGGTVLSAVSYLAVSVCFLCWRHCSSPQQQQSPQTGFAGVYYRRQMARYLNGVLSDAK